MAGHRPEHARQTATLRWVALGILIPNTFFVEAALGRFARCRYSAIQNNVQTNTYDPRRHGATPSLLSCRPNPSVCTEKLAHMKLLDPHIWSVGSDLSVSRAVRREHRAEGLRRWVRSERAHRSSDHRDDFEPGVAVLRLTPRALDCDDHLLGRIDEDDLAKDAIRRKGTVVDAARQVRHRPPVVAVSHRRTGHEPTEASGGAVGLSGEIAPAGRQDPSATESFAVLKHQLAEAAEVAQARTDAKPAQ